MSYRVCFKEKLNFLNFVNLISNNIMINNLINDLINRDGVTNFFCNTDGSFSYSLITEKCEKVYILFEKEFTFISNNLDGNRQQVIYKKNDNGTSIKNCISSKIDYPGYTENRSVEKITKYDTNGKLILNRKITESILTSSDKEVNENLKEMLYENYQIIDDEYLIDDKLIRIQSTNYLYNSDINKQQYFISDCEKGTLGNYDESLYIKPNYVKISLDEYLDKIDQKILKKQKNMI